MSWNFVLSTLPLETHSTHFTEILAYRKHNIYDYISFDYVEWAPYKFL